MRWSIVRLAPAIVMFVASLAAAQEFCVMQAQGCRDLRTGKLYVDRGGRLIDPVTGAVYWQAPPPPPRDPTPSRAPDPAPADSATTGPASPDADLHGIYQTASAGGRLFHHMEVRPDGERRVRIDLLVALTAPSLPGCTGGGVVGSGVLVRDQRVAFTTRSRSASAPAAAACRIDITFDREWGAAEVREHACEAVHGAGCSFAGRYVRVQGAAVAGR